MGQYILLKEKWNFAMQTRLDVACAKGQLKTKT